VNILPAAIQPILTRYAKKEQAPRQADHAADQAAGQITDAKQAWKEQAQRVISELQSSKQGASNLKVQSLLDKFRMGKKLTPAELAYLRKHAPDQAGYIERVSTKRKLVELGMKAAGTKQDVHHVVFLSSQLALKNPNSEEAAASVLQINDAHNEYMKTKEYRDKPDHPWDDLDRSKRSRRTADLPGKYTAMAIMAYEQTKLAGKKPRP
jgi:hypothetical protein